MADGMSGMAEVLNLHYDWAFSLERGEVLCMGCDWSQQVGNMDPAAEVFRNHQAETLTSAGFGPVKEAAAKALEDAADQLARLPYVKPGDGGRDEYERILAVRRGDTDKWLHARAAAVRGEG